LDLPRVRPPTTSPAHQLVPKGAAPTAGVATAPHARRCALQGGARQSLEGRDVPAGMELVCPVELAAWQVQRNVAHAGSVERARVTRAYHRAQTRRFRAR
jgi:hypothetical protein